MKTVGLFCFVCKTIITKEEDMNLRENWRIRTNFEEEGKIMKYNSHLWNYKRGRIFLKISIVQSLLQFNFIHFHKSFYVEVHIHNFAFQNPLEEKRMLEKAHEHCWKFFNTISKECRVSADGSILECGLRRQTFESYHLVKYYLNNSRQIA